jgi:CxxC-x17-CxxC domain-containing protein
MAFERSGGFRPRSGGNSGGGSFGGPREMHDATCSGCGQQTKVPFKPTEGRPVYCRDCFMKQRDQRQ